MCTFSFRSESVVGNNALLNHINYLVTVYFIVDAGNYIHIQFLVRKIIDQATIQYT